jgi:hypothetical protein
LTADVAANTTVAELVLVRMALPAKKPAAASVVRKDISKLLGRELSGFEFEELRSELVSAGCLIKGNGKSLTVTDAGRERALRFLDITAFPPRIIWSTVIAKYLFPKAAGLSAGAASKLNNGDKLAAFLLKRKYGLGPGAGSTASKVLEAIACHQLGYTDETTLEGLLCAVLSKFIGSERLTKNSLAKQLPVFETGLTAVSASAVRGKVVLDWVNGSAPKPPSSPPAEPRAGEPFDVTVFAATVRALAAKSPPQDRFYDNKVFIAPLWQASQRELNFPRLSLADFKQRLVEANSRGLLHLSRADLVQAMDPQLVADSETVYLNATFHFVLLEEPHP